MGINEQHNFHPPHGTNAKSQEEVRKANAKNPRVFIDIEIADVTGAKSRLTKGKKVGRITFELFENAVPKTAENFRALCTGEKVRSTVAIGFRGRRTRRLSCVPYVYLALW